MSIKRTGFYAGLLTGSCAMGLAQAQTPTAPALTISASPTTVTSGAAATLTWTTTNAKSCAASGGWTAATLATAGSKSVANLTKNTLFTITCTNSAGTTSRTALVLVKVATPPAPATTAPTLTVTASPTTILAGSSATLRWNATNVQSCAASGGWTAAKLAASGSQAVAKISRNTVFTVNCANAAGTTSRSTLVLVQSAGSPSPPTVPSAGAVARPVYNTGEGFFVLNGRLYDPDGLEFRIRGVNRNHYDSVSEGGIVKSGSNAVRVFVTTQYGKSWPALASILQNEHIAHQQVAIPANARYTTCVNSTAALQSAVNDWVNNAKTWTALDRNLIVNIANEWGPGNSSVWRDAYINAVKALRAAGYTSTLMIDSGQCGQDMNDLLNYASDVFNSDPQKNIIFSLHLYGLTPTGSVAGNFAKLHSLAQSAGMAFVIGEFGPGRNIGPSPTLTTPGQVISAAEDSDIGWLAWAWDDNNLLGCKSNDDWFSMTLSCGQYAQTADLTLFGKDVVLNPNYGLQKLAKKPNW